jgi:hypothetical protein
MLAGFAGRHLLGYGGRGQQACGSHQTKPDFHAFPCSVKGLEQPPGWAQFPDFPKRAGNFPEWKIPQARG